MYNQAYNQVYSRLYTCRHLAPANKCRRRPPRRFQIHSDGAVSLSEWGTEAGRAPREGEDAGDLAAGPDDDWTVVIMALEPVPKGVFYGNLTNSASVSTRKAKQQWQHRSKKQATKRG